MYEERGEGTTCGILIAALLCMVRWRTCMALAASTDMCIAIENQRKSIRTILIGESWSIILSPYSLSH